MCQYNNNDNNTYDHADPEAFLDPDVDVDLASVASEERLRFLNVRCLVLRSSGHSPLRSLWLYCSKSSLEDTFLPQPPGSAPPEEGEGKRAMRRRLSLRDRSVLMRATQTNLTMLDNSPPGIIAAISMFTVSLSHYHITGSQHSILSLSLAGPVISGKAFASGRAKDSQVASCNVACFYHAGTQAEPTFLLPWGPVLASSWVHSSPSRPFVWHSMVGLGSTQYGVEIVVVLPLKLIIVKW